MAIAEKLEVMWSSKERDTKLHRLTCFVVLLVGLCIPIHQEDTTHRSHQLPLVAHSLVCFVLIRYTAIDYSQVVKQYDTSVITD